MRKLDKYGLLLISLAAFLSLSAATSFSVSSQDEWNEGNFSGTSADRKDNSGTLGLGYLNGSASGQPNEDGLNNGSMVGYWPMDAESDQLSGSFDTKDYSGYGNHGTLKNSEGDERGKQGVFSTNAFDFDGNDDEVETSSTFFGTSTWTQSAWIRMPSSASSRRHAIFGTYDGSFPQVKLLVNDVDSNYAGSLRISDASGSNNFRLFTPNPLNDGNWHHLAATRNGYEYKLYLDGEEVDSNTDSSIQDDLSSGDLTIGARSDDNEHFRGKIESARIYNRTLSSNEIKELYFNTTADKFFEGEYTGQKIDNSQKRNWEKLNVNLSNLPSATDVDANFSALDTNGDIVDSEIINLSQGDNNYTLSVSTSEDARVSFNGTSTNASRSWEIDSYTVYHQAGNRADYVHTFRKGTETPRSFFGNNTGVTIRTKGSFSSDPTVTLTDSLGTTQVNSASMTNLSGIYEFNYTLNGSNGWYDVKIDSNTWENVFYQGEKWQGNYTDVDGNKYTFRRKINVSEKGTGDRFFEPVDVNVDFGFSPDDDSIRVVAWNGSRMLEIPSQIYNVSKTGEAVSNANVVFLSTINQSENRTYYLVSSKSEYRKNYTGLNNTDNSFDERVENSRFEAFFSQSKGGLMREVKDNVGTDTNLSGNEPMEFYPELSVGLTSFKARIDNTAEINVTEGPLFTKISASGNMNDVDSKPYSVDCSIYAANPYMVCEKNLTSKASETWSSFFLNGLIFEDGKFSNVAYRNSSNDVTVKSVVSGAGTDYNSLDSGMRWVSFFDNETGDGVAEIFLQKDFGPTNNPNFQIFDGASNDYFRQRVISSGTTVSAGDYYYTETARMIYNGLRGFEFVNSTYNQLENPVSVKKGGEVTDDQRVVNYSNTGNVSTNDTSSVKVQSYWKDDTFLDYAKINITGNGVNGSNTELYFNDSYNIRDAGDFTDESWVNVTLSNSTVNAGEISANITVFDVAGKSNSTLIEFNVSDATAPYYRSVVNSPNISADLDPNQQVNITSNITEYSDVSTAFLYYKNDSVSDYSKIKMDRDGEKDFLYTYEANFTPRFEDNYTYYVSTNDTLDQRRNSSKNDISVAWDYTWNFEPDLSGETATFNTDVSIGNFTINNTGDFNQTFKLSSGVFNSRTWINGTKLPTKFEISNDTTELFTVNGTTRDSTSTEGLDTFNLTVQNSSASPELNFSSFDVTTSTGGPFLFTEITNYNSTVTQGDTGVKLTAETTNKGNESANTVNITFELPSSWTVSGGESLKSPNTLSLAIGTSETFTTKVDIPNDASTGTKTLEAVAKSQETNRSTSVQVTVEKKDSNSNQQESSSSGGGAGGSGSSGAGGNRLTSEQQQELFQTEETYEMVRGQDQNFSLTVENPFQEGELEDVRVNVSGFLSQYLSVEPNNIDEIGVNDSKNFSINVEAPRYFSRGEYSLNFNITGINNRSQTYTAGNETYLAKDTQEFKENREVELIVHEISKEKASEALNQSREAVKELENQGVMNTETRELISEARDALSSGNYQKAQQISQQIQNKRQKAENADQTLQEVKSLIDQAEYRGLKAPRTSRMVSMASAALERGDYSMAANRAEEAKTLYAIETKGEINYLNYTKRNWQKLGLGLILLIGFSTGGFLRFRLFRIKRKLSKLEEEEETLLGLMKQVQRESFEEGKMSMEEYEEAMMQYEKQLSQNVKNTVRLESRKAHWKNIRKGRERYEHERNRIQELMQETQKKYLDEGEIETRVYKQKMQSFRERLTELEGKLAEIQAQKQIKQKTGIRGKIKNAIPV